MRTPVPPFEPGEETEKGVPNELMKPVYERIAAEQHFDLVPCVWYSLNQQQCLHYDLRPDACRRFETGGDACQMSRWDVGIDI